MTTGQQIVDKAKSEIGKKEDPPGSNRGPFVQMCQAATFLAGTGWPWCAGFVCLIAKLCHVPLAYNGAGAHDLADHHKPWVAPANAEPGMVLDVDEGSGHTCIIASVDHHRHTFDTVNGNWSDQVIEVTFTWAQARAIWKIPGVSYAGGVAPHPPVSKPPKWIVTTSHTGHKKAFRHKRGLIRFLQRHTFKNGITIQRRKAAR